MGSSPVKCKMLLEDEIGSKPYLVHAWGELDERDRFCYLCNYNSSGGILHELSLVLQLIFISLINP